jgi:hypothetical protein
MKLALGCTAQHLKEKEPFLLLQSQLIIQIETSLSLSWHFCFPLRAKEEEEEDVHHHHKSQGQPFLLIVLRPYFQCK